MIFYSFVDVRPDGSNPKGGDWAWRVPTNAILPVGSIVEIFIDVQFNYASEGNETFKLVRPETRNIGNFVVTGYRAVLADGMADTYMLMAPLGRAKYTMTGHPVPEYSKHKLWRRPTGGKI